MGGLSSMAHLPEWDVTEQATGDASAPLDAPRTDVAAGKWGKLHLLC